MIKLTKILSEIKVTSSKITILNALERFMNETIKQNKGDFEVKFELNISRKYDSIMIFDFSNSRNTQYEYTCYISFQNLKPWMDEDEIESRSMDWEEGGSIKEILHELKEWFDHPSVKKHLEESDLIYKIY